jgi:polysaccharide transporter, PST family
MLYKISLVNNLSPNLRKVLSNMSWLLAERVLRVGVGFFIVAWMARYLGTANFGLLNYASAFLVIFNTIASLGLNQIVIRDFVNEPDKRYEIAGTSFVLRLIGAVCGFILAAVTIFYLRPDDITSRNTVVIIAAAMLTLEFQCIDDWFHSQVKSKYIIWATNTAFAVMVIVKIALIQANASVIAFAWAILIESAIGAILSIVVYQATRQKIQKWRFDWSRAQNLMRIGWPLIFSELAIMVYVKIDQVMLGQMSGDNEVGVYSAAVRIAESWLFLLATIVTSVKPSIIEAKKLGEDVYYQKIKQTCSLLSGIVYVVAIPMIFLSTPIVVLVFGKEYVSSGIILAVYFWSSLFTASALIKDIWIAVEEHTTYALITSISGAGANILLNLYLIPKYGALGSAIATVISYVLTDYLSCFFYKPAHKLGWIMTQSFALEEAFKLAKKKLGARS